MKVAVFGSDGQMGRCFQVIQQRNNVRQYRFYNKSQFDICDSSAYHLLESNEFDILLNCAAYTKVDLAETDKEKAYKINVEGSRLLAEYGVRHAIPVIQISTDYVYKSATEPIRESHEIAPINYYGQTKWEGEQAIRKSGVKSLIIRTSWLYSEYGNNFVKTMKRLANTHPTIRVVNDQIGSPTYAVDLANSIDSIIHDGNDLSDLPWGTYNFANHGKVSWYEFAQEILRKDDVQVLPIPSSEYPTPAARPAYSVLDVSAFEASFSFDIRGWKEALKECLEQMDSTGD